MSGLASIRDLHVSGQFSEAEPRYLAHLSQNADDAEASFLLGTLYLQTGRKDKAEHWLARSVALVPLNFAAQLNLGLLYWKTERLEAARACFETAKQLDAHHALLRVSDAGLCLSEGRLDEAEALLAALDDEPSVQLDVLGARIELEDRRGHADAALSLVQVALQRYPDHADFHSQACCIHLNRLDWHAAEAQAEQAVQLEPYNPRHLLFLIRAQYHLEKLSAADANLRRLLALDPANTAALDLLFGISVKSCRVAEGLYVFDRFRGTLSSEVWQAQTGQLLVMLGFLQAAQRYLEPVRASDNPRVVQALAYCHELVNEHDQAIALYQRVVAHGSAFVSARLSLGLLLLGQQRWKEGWPYYEARFTQMDWKLPDELQHVPVWQGEALGPSEVLQIITEQGVGDVLQALRYLPMVRARAPHVMLSVEPGVLSLLGGTAGATELDALPEVMQAPSRYVPFFDLPRVLHAPPDPVPSEVPYLFPDPLRVEQWRERLAAKPGLRVGLCWGGNPQHARDHMRSMRLNVLEPLASVPGVRWISLQKGLPERELRSYAGYLEIEDYTAELGDYADTAALVANLDLVITVDTSVAHLAGALGRPVWTLLYYLSEWRWGTSGDTTLWYPTMRLFRQQAMQDWSTPVADMLEALRVWVGDHAAAPVPQLLAMERALQKDQRAEASQIGQSLQLDLVPRSWPVLRVLARLDQAGLLPQSPPWLAGELGRWDLGRADTPSGCAGQDLASPVPVHRSRLQAAWERGDRTELARLLAVAETAYPEHPAWCRFRARLAAAQQDWKSALHAYDQALAHDPKDPDLLLEMAEFVDFRFGVRALVLGYYQQVNLARPFDPRAQLGLARTFIRMGQPGIALDMLGDIAQRYPALPQVAYWQAHACMQLGEHDTPAAHLARELTQAPAGEADWVMRVDACWKLGLGAQVTQELDEAIRHWPDSPVLGFQRAAMKLIQNDPAGWQDYDKRLDNGLAASLSTAPVWRGESLDGKTLLLRAEQGLGDTLYFSRLLAGLAPSGRVVLACQKDLVPLLRPLADEVLPLDPEQPYAGAVDYEVPFGSLPGILRVDLAEPPGIYPYISADPQQSELWAERLASFSGHRVGVVWAGNPDHRHDHVRSIPFRTVVSLFEMPEVRWFSLQLGDAAWDLHLSSASAQVVALGNAIEGWTDTAAALANLDLLLTVDTSIAHLAGAMGVPTWLMVPKYGDWRWQMDGEACGWYPSVRLFRQRHQGDWDEVLQDVQHALRQWVEQR